MDYYEAAKKRKRGLIDNITDKLISGQSVTGSIGSSISEKIKSRAVGIKEKFDPLNVAKMFGGKLGVAAVGRLTGRSKSDMSYFTGKRQNRVGGVENVGVAFYTTIAEGQKVRLRKNDRIADVAAKIYNLMKRSYEERLLNLELFHDHEKEIHDEEKMRHKDLLDEFEYVDVKEKKSSSSGSTGSGRKKSKNKSNLPLVLGAALGAGMFGPDMDAIAAINEINKSLDKLPEFPDLPDPPDLDEIKLPDIPENLSDLIKIPSMKEMTELPSLEDLKKDLKEFFDTDEIKEGEEAPSAEPPKPSATRQDGASNPEAPSAEPPKPSATRQDGASNPIPTHSKVTVYGKIKNKIAGKESAGADERSYHLMNKATEDDDNYFPNLTEMSIGEVINLAKKRSEKFGKKGAGAAAGKYQFMPNTLAGVAQKAFGKNWESIKFSAENQEKLMDVLMEDEISFLRRSNIPVSEFSIYLVHFLGTDVDKIKAVLSGPAEVSMRKVLGDAGSKANSTIAEMTVGQYRNLVIGNNTNSLSAENLQFDEGDKLSRSSVESQDLKEQGRPSISIDNTQRTTVVASSGTPSVLSNSTPKENPLILKLA